MRRLLGRAILRNTNWRACGVTPSNEQRGQRLQILDDNIGSRYCVVANFHIMVRQADRTIDISPFRGSLVFSAACQHPVFVNPTFSSLDLYRVGTARNHGTRIFLSWKEPNFLCDVSVLVAEIIKNQLKFLFGRSWPDSWGPNILSLVHNNVYGFHFLQSGKFLNRFHLATPP